MTRYLPALILAVAGALSLGAACRRTVPTAAVTDADTALCAKLAAVGCATGKDPSCPAALARLRTLGPVPDTCVLSAGDPAAIRVCGLECTP